MYGKLDRYLLIALVIIGIACLYFLFTGSKKDNDRDSLLLQMARKLGASDSIPKPAPENTRKEPDPEPEPPYVLNEEEEAYITSIADKICFSKPLDANEQEFYKDFSKEIDSELENSRKVLSILINKFLTGVREFDEFEKEFYEANKEEIDTIVNNRKMLESIIQKLMDGKTEFNDDELQFQANYANVIEKELAKRKETEEVKAGSNPPLAPDARLKLILSLFEDNKPKTITELAKLYAEKTSTKPHTGNMSNIFGRLVDDGKLMCTKAGKDKKVYHGLPQWFDGKKLKPEYQPTT